MYLNDNGINWLGNSGWLGSENHCTWEGMTCSNVNRVTEINLQSNQLSGSFPTYLINLGQLNSLNMGENSLSGTIPNDLCDRSTSNILYISGDAANCPNEFNATSGVYLEGCCDHVFV